MGKNAGNLQNRHRIEVELSSPLKKESHGRGSGFLLGPEIPFLSAMSGTTSDQINMFKSLSLVEGFLSLFCMLIYQTLVLCGQSKWLGTVAALEAGETS